MHDRHFDIWHTHKICRDTISEVHAAVLPACAAEGHLQTVTPIPPVLLDRLADERLGRHKEWLDNLRKAGEKVADGLVAARVAAQSLVPKRVGHGSAIENKASSVTRGVFWQASTESE